MTSRTARLASRGLVRITGADARTLLQGLITNDVLEIGDGEARFAALLTPQGKILFDFFVTPARDDMGGGLILDCNRDQAADLAKRLGFYKLRAKAEISDISHEAGVVALWGGDRPVGTSALLYPDMRSPGMGWRAIAPLDMLGAIAGLGEEVEEAEWDGHRIREGVPQGGCDFGYGDAFPHDTNMDLIGGVDFRKGCYIGQEVVSRVQHRGTARKRIAKVRFEGAPPMPGIEIRSAEGVVGAMGSGIEGAGLATLRLDKIDDKTAPLNAGEMVLHLVD